MFVLTVFFSIRHCKSPCALQAVGSAISLYYISPELTYLIGLSVPVMVLAGTLLGAVLRKLSSAAQAQVSSKASVACGQGVLALLPLP